MHAAGATDAVAGECLVELDAAGAQTALAVIHRLELPLSLHFNRSRLMVMPVAVSKATGLREALHPDVLAATECVVVTHQSEARESRLLHDAWNGAGPSDAWQDVPSGLAIEEAALLPVTDEAHGRLQRFRLAPRLTRHVRHRHKYFDVGVDPAVVFLFVDDDGSPGPRVRSLSEVVDTLASGHGVGLRRHLQRGDLSRWVDDVFGDRTLARQLREIEERVRLGAEPDPTGAVIAVIEAAYGPPHPTGAGDPA